MADAEPKFELVSRKEAIARGLRFYFTGRPCKFGHINERRLATNRCKTCEYESTQKWRRENREYVRERDNAYRDKNRERFRELERARYAKNPSKFIEKQQAFYAKNGESIREKRKVYHYEIYTDPTIRAAAAARTKQWALDNPEKVKANARNGKAKRRHIPGTHTAEDIVDIFKMQKGRCAYCRKPLGLKYEVDHIKPVSKGGTNDRKNIQLAHSKCNRAKGAREPEFHARMLGMLI